MLDNILFRRKIRKHIVTRSPIFILGHMRSGTTHLHNLLALDSRFAAPKTFDAYAFDFFLTGKFLVKPFIKWLVPKKREMDNMVVDLDLPQEEEFSQFSTSTYSFFYHMFFPQRADYFYRKFILTEGLSDKEKESFCKSYQFLIKKFSFAYKGKQLLLKNPVNTGRLKILLEMFPDAKFIYIHRNPVEVYYSTLHLYEKLLLVCQLQKTDKESIRKMVINNYKEMMTSYHQNKKLINNGNLVEVDYEALDKRPLELLELIYKEVKLEDFDEIKPLMQKYLEQIYGYKKNTFNISKEQREELSHQLTV